MNSVSPAVAHLILLTLMVSIGVMGALPGLHNLMMRGINRMPSPDDISKNPIPWILGIAFVIFLGYFLLGGPDGQTNCGGQQYTAEYCE